MKRWLIVILVACSAAALLAADVQNIGHRGTGSNAAYNDYPENTIPSFLQAFAEGADMVELDVLLSGDDEVIVIHDSTLDRTTDCTGGVIDKTLAEIQLCDAAWGTSLQGTGVIVPTLGEVFAAVSGEINVEIKTNNIGEYTAEHLVERVLDEIDAAGAADRVIISSFGMNVCTEVKDAGSDIPVAFLTSEVAVMQEIDDVIAAGLDGIHPYGAQTLALHVDYAHDNGLFVNVWTIDPIAALQLMISRGVDGIVTNEPDVLAGLLGDDDTVDDDTVDDDTVDDDTVDDDTVDDDTIDDDTIDDDTTDDDTIDDDVVDDDIVDDDVADDDVADDDDDDNDDGCGC